MNNEYEDNEIIEMEEDREQLEQILLQTEWVEEAEQIPLDTLPSDEQLVVLKCRNKQDLTKEEMNILREVLGRYRPAIRKLEPSETIETVEKNIQVTKDMNNILARMKDARNTETIEFSYPLSADEVMKVEIVINKEIDAQTIDDLQENLGMFEDFSRDELQTYSKYAHSETMSREEQAIAQRIEEKIYKMESSSIADLKDTAIDFLSTQTKLVTDGAEPSVDDMKEFYSLMTFGPLFALFERVQGVCGVSHIDKDALFR